MVTLDWQLHHLCNAKQNECVLVGCGGASIGCPSAAI